MKRASWFLDLIKDRQSILVSDGYRVYRRWTGRRQTCLAHLIREAKGLSERSDPDLARFGVWARKELLRFGLMAKSPPSVGEKESFVV